MFGIAFFRRNPFFKRRRKFFLRQYEKKWKRELRNPLDNKSRIFFFPLFLFQNREKGVIWRGINYKSYTYIRHHQITFPNELESRWARLELRLFIISSWAKKSLPLRSQFGRISPRFVILSWKSWKRHTSCNVHEYWSVTTSEKHWVSENDFQIIVKIWLFCVGFHLKKNFFHVFFMRLWKKRSENFFLNFKLVLERILCEINQILNITLFLNPNWFQQNILITKIGFDDLKSNRFKIKVVIPKKDSIFYFLAWSLSRSRKYFRIMF
jgi:hypothetical protein